MRLAGTSGVRMARVVGVVPSTTGAQTCGKPGVVSTTVNGSKAHTPPACRYSATPGRRSRDRGCRCTRSAAWRTSPWCAHRSGTGVPSCRSDGGSGFTSFLTLRNVLPGACASPVTVTTAPPPCGFVSSPGQTRTPVPRACCRSVDGDRGRGHAAAAVVDGHPDVAGPRREEVGCVRRIPEAAVSTCGPEGSSQVTVGGRRRRPPRSP